MAKAKHTPGPWAVFIDRPSKTLTVMPAMRSGDIANIVYADDEKSDVECEANASLIAAAPDLLQFAQRASEACSFPADDFQRAMRDEARKVIAKATA